MSNQTLVIVDREISKINPAPYNPRDITSPALGGLVMSLKTFGMVDPLVVNKRNNVLVGGHQRLKAAEVLGWTTVPVVEVDLNEANEKALNVTLNNPRISGFFTDELQIILNEFKVDLGEELFIDLKLNELIISDEWASGFDAVDKIEENLDGITATIKITCPTMMKKELVQFLHEKISETGFTDVEIV